MISRVLLRFKENTINNVSIPHGEAWYSSQQRALDVIGLRANICLDYSLFEPIKMISVLSLCHAVIQNLGKNGSNSECSHASPAVI